MKISARNVFDGSVAAIKLGAVNSEVDVVLVAGAKVVATVTNDSVAYLGLAVGNAVKVIIKASSIMVMTDATDIKLSARNRLEGVIETVTEGPVSCEVAIKIGAGMTMYASITHHSSTGLGLQVGMSVTAVFKAPSVIIGVAVANN